MPANKPNPIPALTDRDIDRFWSHIDVKGPDECWPWKLSPSKNGYGLFSVTIDGVEKMISAHRLAYFLKHGEPGELLVCHTCDFKLCCNDNHHFLGNTQQNVDDMIAKGRKKAHKGQDQAMATLSNEQVIEIRKRYAEGAKQQALADEFGTGQGNISRIVSGARWGHMEGGKVMTSEERSVRYRGVNQGQRKKPTIWHSEEKIREIKQMIKAGVSNKTIGEKFNMLPAYIYAIKTGKIWKSVVV